MITYAPRMMMVSVIALHTLAISSPAVASPDELLRRGLTYTRCCGKNRQEQHADHGPLREGPRPAFSAGESRIPRSRNAGLFVYSTGIHYQDPLAEGDPDSNPPPSTGEMVWAGDEEMAPSTSSMQIVVTRVDAHRYSTLVERDGVRLRVPGYASIRSLPHDLAHFVVEGSLGLDRGFWGSVADGAQEVGGMTRDLRVPVAAGTLLRDCQRGVRPQEAGCRSRGVEFAPDSPLEEAGFEPSVPLGIESVPCWWNRKSGRGAPPKRSLFSRRDWGFESPLLQRRGPMRT